ncbi:MAG: hypothetical protein HYV28_16485 [Ignavibacteriales bacterium]|nr:hypothetical protein [Ignavibacteriales bacterium]
MKPRYFIAILLFTLLWNSCSPALDNSIVISSIAAADVVVNILGKLITVKPGETRTLRQVAKGSYEYSTSFTVPTGITSSSIEGKASGTVAMGPQTKINLFFSSREEVSTSSGGSAQQKTYVLVATVSSSDKVSSSTTSP